MSDFKNDPGHGQLFKNKYKEKDNQPDYKGKFTDLDGNAMDISAWLKDGRNGKYLSLSIQKEWIKPESKDDGRPTPKPIGDFDDDIPF